MQKIRHIAYNIYYTGIAIVFVESRHILSKEILENSDFASLNLVIAINGEKEAYITISHLYKSNILIQQEE